MKKAFSKKNLWDQTQSLVKNTIGRGLGIFPPEWLLGAKFRANCEFVKEAQWWPVERYREYQLKKLQGILKLAYEKTEFYRHTFDSIGFHPGDFKSLDCIKQLPIIDKQIIIENLGEMCTRSVTKRNVDYASTGGTSGRPLHFYIDADRSAIEYAYLTTSWKRVGYKLGMPMAVLRGRIVKPNRNGLRHDYDPILRHHYYSNFHMTNENIQLYLNHIRTIGPCIFHAYPSSAHTIANYITKTGEPAPQNIKGIFLESENIYQDQIIDIEKAFGVKTFSCYGHSEKLVLAAQCEHTRDYHVWPTYGYFELLDAEGKPIRKAGQEGEIVGTGFINTVVPFIRYRTGDYAAYVGESCRACGREHTLITDVKGRWPQGWIIGIDGSVVSMTALNVHDDTFKNVREYQFLQSKPGKATLCVIPATTLDEKEKNRIINNMNKRLQGQVVLNLEMRTELIKTERGKQPRVIHNSNIEIPKYKMDKSVSVLITWDVDPFLDVCIEAKRVALNQTRQLLDDLQIKSTFFTPARMAEQLEEELRSLIPDGHEIGCHGLTHGEEENYNRMPIDMQRKYLYEATEILRDKIGENICSFRGSRMKTSHVTQQLLVELGYTADCSVASQRIDFVSSNLINFSWIFAPRLPYLPSDKSAFRKGDRNIWVVPLSAAIVPFISSALYILKTGFMKSLFKLLYKESLRNGKPIVYLIHPFEFAESTLRHKPENISTIESIRTHGFLFRERLLEKDHHKRFKMNQELFAYMKTFPNVKFMTVGDYVTDILMKK